MHFAFDPHCVSLEQAPHVPLVQTSPAGHFALEVHPVVIVVQLPLGHDLHAWYEVQ